MGHLQEPVIPRFTLLGRLRALPCSHFVMSSGDRLPTSVCVASFFERPGGVKLDLLFPTIWE